jgi:uncharacterized protein with von Willebrand factor type A (vWA) domain
MSRTGDAQAGGADPAAALLPNLVRFGRLLRALGLPVSPADLIEAAAALSYIDIKNQRDLYYALRALLVSDPDHLPLFATAFAQFWRAPQSAPPAGQAGRPGDGADDGSVSRQVAMPGAEAAEEIVAEGLAWAAAATSAADDTDPDAAGALHSARESLRRRAFDTLSPEERRAMAARIEQVVGRRARQRPGRRMEAGHDAAIDARLTLRRNLRHGGELLHWAYRTPKLRPRPLLIFADISGSMGAYTEPILYLLYALARWPERRVEAFLMGTRLTRITPALQRRNVDASLGEIGDLVQDWSGGTRLGQAFREFNRRWGGAFHHRRPVVLIISDGWDRGDPALLGGELARLHRASSRLIWLNPLLGQPDYAPLTRGMQAALPHVDDFLPVHSLESIERLLDLL